MTTAERERLLNLREKRVALLSPLAGDFEANIAYARKAMRHSLSLGEAPFASHLLYPQCLDDRDPKSRELGIECEHAWITGARAVVVYVDRGITPSMQRAIDVADSLALPIVYRNIQADIAVDATPGAT